MYFRTNVFLVLLLSLLAECAGASNVSPITEQHSCFSRFPTYQAWMDYLWEKNSALAYAAMRWRYDEEDYTRYSVELDCRSITYTSGDQSVRGFIIVPKARRNDEKLPVIVFNRGGNAEFGALTMPLLLDHVFPLAEQGYVVLASQYRGVPSPTDGQPSPDEFGGEDVNDVTKLIAMVPELPEADPENIFMVGQSRGAIMTFRALLQSPLPVRAVAIQSGAYDMRDLLAFRPEFETLFKERIPGYDANRDAALDLRSVTAWPDRLPPETGVLLVHGTEDERAPLVSAEKFGKQLLELGRPSRLVILDGENHNLQDHRDEVRKMTLDWFRSFQHRSTLNQSPMAAAAP